MLPEGSGVDISICIPNIAIVFDISLKIEKGKLKKVERRNAKFKKTKNKISSNF